MEQLDGAPDRAVNSGDSRSLTGRRARRLTFVWADQQPGNRSLPSWSCRFDPGRPLFCSGPGQGRSPHSRSPSAVVLAGLAGHIRATRVLASGALLPSFRLVGRLRRGAAHVADEGAERFGDGLVTVAGAAPRRLSRLASVQGAATGVNRGPP